MYQHSLQKPSLMIKLLLGLLLSTAFIQHSIGATAGVIQLTQTPCQFLESEGNQNHGYQSSKKADCEAINNKSAKQRLAQAQPLKLKAGSYTFRVSNKNVSYDLGFWLRGDGIINRAKLPSVSGGGLSTGTTLDYKIDLKPGEYVYSCPLNSTPDYKLLVVE